MDFSNNGKIKKIFYIVAIISMLLSIKSKVLGASDLSLTLIKGSSAGVGGVTYTAELPSFLNDKYWFIQQISRSNGTFDTYLYYSDDYFSITSNSSSGQFGMYVTSVFLNYSGNDNTYTYNDNFTNHSVNSINGTYLLNTAWLNASTFIYGNFDLYINGNLVNIEHIISGVIYPYFENVTEIENGNPDGVIIDPGDFSKTDNIYFHLLEIQTGISSADDSIYYYLDKTFLLNKDSDYFSTMLADPNVFYYFIPRYKLGLSQNSSYLYVINNSKNQIQNSHGLIEIDKANGIYDVVSSDTTGVITATEEESDRMKNIEESIANNENTISNINNTINNTNITEDTETDIDTNLNYNNNNESLTLLNNGFFTRLTNLLSNISNYNLNEDTSISLPLPNSNKSLILHSIDLNNNINGTLRTIINAFWTYIFTFYLWKFINKIYISITTGNILDSFSSSGEAITNNML